MAELDNEPLEEDEDYDEEEVNSVKEALQNLTKTVKTQKIYLPNNPIHQKFTRQLLQLFQTHLETFGPLRLRIKRFELRCSGQVIYENADRLESIAFRLFVDGLRELSFHPGLDKEEMTYFLDVLGRDELAAGVDDDMVTLLWERHFSHIQYVVVDELAGELDDIKNAKEMQREAPSTKQLQAVYEEEAAVAPGALEPKGIEIPSLHIFKLTQEEINSIKRELRWEEEIDIVNELLDMLFDIIRIERDAGVFSEVLDIIDNILQQLMYRGDFSYAKKVLTFFHEMIEVPHSQEVPHRLLVQEALMRAGTSERILKLAPVLNRLSGDHVEALRAFFLLFNKEVIPPMIDLLAEVNTMKARRVLCDILAELGHKDYAALVTRLNDDRWFLVRNLIYILGKMQDERTVDHLSQFVNHYELKVRKEVLHVLDAMEDQRATALLLEFLPDPDLSNRVYTIKCLAKKKVKAGMPRLLKMMHSKEFDEKALYEKKEIYTAYVSLGGDAAIPEIARSLKTAWSIFRNVQAEERGICATVSLRRLASPAAAEALRVGSRSKNKAIREACETALKRLGSKTT